MEAYLREQVHGDRYRGDRTVVIYTYRSIILKFNLHHGLKHSILDHIRIIESANLLVKVGI